MIPAYSSQIQHFFPEGKQIKQIHPTNSSNIEWNTK